MLRYVGFLFVLAPALACAQAVVEYATAAAAAAFWLAAAGADLRAAILDRGEAAGAGVSVRDVDVDVVPSSRFLLSFSRAPATDLPSALAPPDAVDAAAAAVPYSTTACAHARAGASTNRNPT